MACLLYQHARASLIAFDLFYWIDHFEQKKLESVQGRSLRLDVHTYKGL